ncbi:potassium efflux system protein [Modicisalibacter muralis]|uniref:Potassium efflux system protein n=1 Tax=Modicisalibacter muralis TaxID=119000 RepID=A0A1G9F4F1_9GAMM|nr:mechanosensitive channel MscK [Halomonas muralis]SDK83266.1 potassium efflux system protein [Halomonas muralis]
MQAFERAVKVGLLCWLLLLSANGWAQQSPSQASLPTREAVAQRLESLTAQDQPGASQSEEIETLRATLETLDEIAALEASRDELEQRLKRAPEEIRRLDRALREIADSTTPSAASLEAVSQSELETRIADTLDELQALRDRLAETNARLIAAQTLPERAQTAITEALSRIEELRLTLDGATTDEPRVWLARSERYLAESQLAFKRRELANNARLQELAELRSEVLGHRVDNLEDRLSLLQAVLDQKRRQALETTISESAGRDPLLANHPLASQVQAVNRQLNLELLDVIDRDNHLEREGVKVRAQLDRVRQVQRTLTEQIEAIRGSLLLSRILREQRNTLPRVNATPGLQENIADIRLKQFDLGRQREALRDARQRAVERIQEAGIETTPALLDSLTRLYELRRELTDQLELEYGELLTTAIDLQLNQQQLLDISETLRATIEEQLFWVASRSPLDLAWLRQVPNLVVTQATEGQWRKLLAGLWQSPRLAALWSLPLFLLAAGLLLRRWRIKAHLKKLHEQIGRLKHDTQMHTPRAVCLNAMLAAPGPLTMAGIGVALTLIGEAFGMRLGAALLQLSLAWGVVALARRLLVADGVAIRHFHWPAAYAARLRYLLRLLGLALIPVLLISGLARGDGPSLAASPLALALLLAGLVAMSVLTARLILAHVPHFGVKLFRLLLGLALSAVTLVLGGLIVLGYEYTALRLIGRFVASLYIFGLWILIEAAVVRGLAVAARRLAYRRAVARRRAQVQEGAEGGLEVVEEPPLDLEQVNQQSLRLSKLILFLGFTLVLYLVWADLLAVLSYLDNVEVWSTVSGSGESLSETPISVANLLVAVVIVVLTFVMARNLPGLLEVMVLSRLSLKQGSAYAISSLLSYAIVGTGIVVALSTLGVAWSKLQWLVAALGVGLGFGLQEIFANFISGLIILFERPMRIGDTITLGNLHGTVSRIRIRATTVTDFDRKEIIIPNKTFVTDQLINWSLSDNITRVVLNYGVAHGSDLDSVHRLLLEAASANKRVLKDPEPQVFCTSYGATAFNFELRIFVNDLLDRLYAADEINRRLDVLFREHGVRVAFNQMDVWLHDSEGRETKVVSQPEDKPLGEH